MPLSTRERVPSSAGTTDCPRNKRRWPEGLLELRPFGNQRFIFTDTKNTDVGFALQKQSENLLRFVVGEVLLEKEPIWIKPSIGNSGKRQLIVDEVRLTIEDGSSTLHICDRLNFRMICGGGFVLLFWRSPPEVPYKSRRFLKGAALYGVVRKSVPAYRCADKIETAAPTVPRVCGK